MRVSPLFLLFGAFSWAGLSPTADVHGQVQPQEGLQLLLNNFSNEVRWSKYFSGGKDFDWNGTLGIHFEAIRYRGVSLFFDGVVETIIERDNDFWNFEPQEVHYVLVPGLQFDILNSTWAILLDHHSRHDSDRFDGFKERWNVLMFQHVWVVEPGELFLLRAGFGGGKVVASAETDYDWEARVQVNILSRRSARLRPYANAWVLAMRTKNSPSGRRGFLDRYAEIGLRIPGVHGDVALFGGYHHRHDIDHFDGKDADLVQAGILFEFGQ